MESMRSKIVVGVVLTVVGAVASTFMGWIPNPFEASAAEATHDAAVEVPAARTWLVVEGVELFGRLPDEHVKVTAHVNGTTFVYPDLEGVEWTAVGPAMASQTFLLPTGADRIEIRFEMESRSGLQFKSPDVDVVGPAELPHAGDYNLHQVENRARAAPVSAAVRYTLTRNP